MYLCHPWGMWHKMNAIIFLFVHLWHCLALIIFNSTENLASSNLHKNRQAVRMFPIHSSSLQMSWHFIYKIYDCYVIHNNYCIFIVLLFICEKSCSGSTRSLPVSQSFRLFCHWSSFLVFSLMVKSNIFCTAADSPYVCRQVIY